MFNDRNTNFLTFWVDNINKGQNAGRDPNVGESNNLLTLAFNGSGNNVMPAVGIGTGLDTPDSHLELRNRVGDSYHTFTISSYDKSAIGSATTNYSLGSNAIMFKSGRYQVQSGGNNTYETAAASTIYSGFMGTEFAGGASAFGNAKLGIQTLSDIGSLADTIVAQNVRVGIAGPIKTDKTLTVHGSTWSQEYWSDNSNGQKGGTTDPYICVAVPCKAPTGCALKLRFEDGLFICSCTPSPPDSCDGVCTCTNP